MENDYLSIYEAVNYVLSSVFHKDIERSSRPKINFVDGIFIQSGQIDTWIFNSRRSKV